MFLERLRKGNADSAWHLDFRPASSSPLTPSEQGSESWHGRHAVVIRDGRKVVRRWPVLPRDCAPRQRQTEASLSSRASGCFLPTRDLTSISEWDQECTSPALPSPQYIFMPPRRTGKGHGKQSLSRNHTHEQSAVPGISDCVTWLRDCSPKSLSAEGAASP